jgi:hypothetical protein
LRRAFSRVADPLRDELAQSWPVALLVLALSVVALAAVLPVLSLRSGSSPSGTALALEPIAPMGPVVSWTADVLGPSATQAAALRDLFPVLLGAGWGVLAIALIAALGRLVAQSYERGPEIGLRRAVGAARRHILGAQLAEAALIAAAALAIALPAGYGLLRVAVAAWPGPVSGAGFAPAIPVMIVLAVLLIGALLPLAHRSARRLTGGDPMPVTLGLPAAQIAGAIAVLTAGVALRHHADLVSTGEGSTANGAVWELEAPALAPPARAAAYAALVERLGPDSGYRVTSLASRGAHAGLGTVDFDVTDCGFCVRSNIVMRWLNLEATHHAITPDTFTAAGIRLVEGRGIRAADHWSAPRVAVVNRHLAARYFERGGAVGRDIYLGTAWPKQPHRVVGIVDDERPSLLGGALQPRETVYLSALQHPPAAAELVLRSASGGITAPAEPLLRAAADGTPRAGPATTERERAAAHAAPLAWFGRWFGIAGLAALVVALAAAFDTSALWVRSVSGELAMRRAAGATRRRIATYVAVRAAMAVAAGAAGGTLIYTTLVRDHLARSVPALAAWDPGATAAAAGVLLLAALAGAGHATRRFLRTEPARWLR